MPLDPTNTQPGYVAGRIIAVLDALETAVLGPSLEREICYRGWPATLGNPALAPRLAATRAPIWLRKLAQTDPDLAALYQARLADVIDLLGTQPLGADIQTRSWVQLGYYHQLTVDIQAGLRADQGSGHLTTSQVGETLGYTGDHAHKAAARWLHRAGIRPTGREAGRTGQNIYPREVVQAAIASRPGRGARTDRRTTEEK
jgi:hypothetical protein